MLVPALRWKNVGAGTELGSAKEVFLGWSKSTHCGRILVSILLLFSEAGRAAEGQVSCIRVGCCNSSGGVYIVDLFRVCSVRKFNLLSPWRLNLQRFPGDFISKQAEVCIPGKRCGSEGNRSWHDVRHGTQVPVKYITDLLRELCCWGLILRRFPRVFIFANSFRSGDFRCPKGLGAQPPG